MDFTRDELGVLHTRSAALGAGMVACDVVGYLVSLACVAHAASWLAQALFSLCGVIFVGRLFMLGHDACHQALTPNGRLNRWLGTLAFLPSLHPFSLWDLGHNRIHHRFTNQRGLDYVWEPLDPESTRACRRSSDGATASSGRRSGIWRTTARRFGGERCSSRGRARSADIAVSMSGIMCWSAPGPCWCPRS